MFYKVIGLMSGTSLDGLDIAYCHFLLENNKWRFGIIEAQTIEYNQEIREKLLRAENTSSEDFVRIDKEFGHFLGRETKEFIDKHNLEVDFISSHGQTIFHQPNIQLTTQIGDINAIAAQTGIKTIGDFRRKDLALKGQGAPLVPIGDRLLFSEYPYCLNLGGFSNISFEECNKDKSTSQRIAYDICPVNIVLNHFANIEGLVYDKDGALSRSGKPNKKLLNKLNSIEFYSLTQKKSLGKEWVKENIFPVLEESNLSTKDVMATFIEHITDQLAINIKDKVFITGGGVYNKHLIDRLASKIVHQIHIPDNIIVNYKEALIFAFLGVLRERKEINVLASVTGAERDSCSGIIVE